MTRRTLTEAQQEAIWVRRLLGESLDTLSAEYGLAASTIASTYGFWPIIAGGRHGKNLSGVARALGRDRVAARVRAVLQYRKRLRQSAARGAA